MSIQSRASEITGYSPTSADCRVLAVKYCGMTLDHVQAIERLLDLALSDIVSRRYPADLIAVREGLDAAIAFVDIALDNCNRGARR